MVNNCIDNHEAAHAGQLGGCDAKDDGEDPGWAGSIPPSQQAAIEAALKAAEMDCLDDAEDACSKMFSSGSQNFDDCIQSITDRKNLLDPQ